MKLIITSLSLVLLVGTLNSCNKTKTNANRIEDGEWDVTELSVDGVNEDELPHLHFSDCDAYSSACTGEWENHEGGKGNFAWQFNDKGETFAISNQSEVTGEHATDEAILQCQNFSGNYKVVECTKKTMAFETTSALAYVGKTVILKMEKE
jgi:hypothetical protein